MLQMSQTLSIQGIIIIVSRLGPENVTIFVVTRSFVNLLRQLLSALSHSSWSEFTNLHSNQNFSKLTLLLSSISRLSLIASVLFFMILYYFGDSIFKIWLTDQIKIDIELSKVYFAYTLLGILWSLQSHVLMASNKHKILAKCNLFFGGLSLFFCWYASDTNNLILIIYILYLVESIPMLLITNILICNELQNYNDKKIIIYNSLLYLLASILVIINPVTINILFIYLIYISLRGPDSKTK